MTEKIVLIGAGSANFGLEAVSDIYRSKFLKGAILYYMILMKNPLKKLKK